MAKMPFLDAVASMSDDRAASERQRPKFSSMARMNTKMPAGQKTKFSQLSLQSNLKKGSSPAIGARAGWRPGVWYVLNSNRWVISHDQNPRLGLTSGTFANLNGGRWDLVGRAISSLDAHLSPASGRTVRQGPQNIVPTATAKTGISLRSVPSRISAKPQPERTGICLATGCMVSISTGNRLGNFCGPRPDA